MSSTNKTPFRVIIQSLNRIFWLASIGLWLWIVLRSQIWSADLAPGFFWVNFLIFLAAGLGTVATTHFAASALPLCFGVLALTADQDKAGWVWLNMYVVAATATGFFAGIIKLNAYLDDRRSSRADRDS
jgi:hypothetical protein